MQIFIAIVAVFLILSGLLWVIVPAIYGLPPVSTKRERIRRALELANLQAGETLYDLGSGHGRVLVMAAKEFGARAVGIEIGPVQCAISWGNALRNGVRSKVKIEPGNFYHADLSRADVIFAYHIRSSRPSSRKNKKGIKKGGESGYDLIQLSWLGTCIFGSRKPDLSLRKIKEPRLSTGLFYTKWAEITRR